MHKLNLLKETNRLNELISLQVNRYINKKVSDGITAKQHLCLIYLGNSQGSTAGEIGKILDISKSSISQLLKRLEDQDLIFRKINKNNRKEVNVFLDKKGEEYFNKYLKIKEEVLLEYFLILEEEEINTLLSLNKKILQHIRNKNVI